MLSFAYSAVIGSLFLSNLINFGIEAAKIGNCSDNEHTFVYSNHKIGEKVIVSMRKYFNKLSGISFLFKFSFLKKIILSTMVIDSYPYKCPSSY
jgi:hypothetical protein